jgi:deoxyribonuclease-4
MIIGSHLSAAKGFYKMGETAVSMGANTFQFFTRNPRGGSIKKLSPDDIQAFLVLAKKHDFPVVLAHAPYTLNAASDKPAVLEFAYEAMTEDLARMEYLPGNLYNFHPGSHVGQGTEAGIEKIASLLNRVLHPEQTTTVLLETMSGKGSEIGGSFEELREILDRVTLSEKMGVCMDICHVHDAGYDVVHNLDTVLSEFDRIIGLERLLAIHLNDSMNPLGSHKDRHALIGKGTIGLDAMVRVIRHPALRHLPFFLETPTDEVGHAEEIRVLREAYESQP